MKSASILWFLLFILIIVSTPFNTASAYLDPGSGSLIIQIIVAGILGALVAIRMFWGRILLLFHIKKPSESQNDDTEA